MLFALGYISGITTAALIAALLMFFRKPIDRIIHQAQAEVDRVAPGGQGFLLESDDEADIAREEIVRKNAEIGRDTPISELR